MQFRWTEKQEILNGIKKTAHTCRSGSNGSDIGSHYKGKTHTSSFELPHKQGKYFPGKELEEFYPATDTSSKLDTPLTRKLPKGNKKLMLRKLR